MIKFGVYSFAITVIIANFGYAFNKERCRTRFPYIYEGFGSKGLFLTTHPVDSTTWSSQITSSWGECSLLGQWEQRGFFIAANAEHIIMESARGNGEYLNALAELSGCGDNSTQIEFGRAIQNNFETIYFDGTSEASILEISNRIDKMIKKNSKLRSTCRVS